MDRLSILGVIIAFGALLGGNYLDGGSWQSLLNGPAALIVIGGTIGAAVLQTSRQNLGRATQLLLWIILPPSVEFQKGIARVVHWSNAARREGLLGLEGIAQVEKDLFNRKGLQLLIDGSQRDVIRHVLESDLLIAEQRDFDASHFYESMGGYAPTIGIIGAVMGLIEVMHHLSDPSALGPGIAVAFVATIYGVAFANLLLLPVASKLKQCIREKSQYHELIIEGILAIADGENPIAIERKLSGYLRP